MTAACYLGTWGPGISKLELRKDRSLTNCKGSKNRAWRRAFTLLTLLAASGAGAQETGDDRFATVQSWVGLLDVRVTASGTDSVPGGTITYTVDRHLNYPFTLDGPGFPIGWWTCSTALSHGTIDDVFVSHNEHTGCENTYRYLASGQLETPPPEPNSPPGWPPCTLHGFQLQIIPIPFTDTYTSWGFFDTIKGQDIVHEGSAGDCTPFQFTSDTTFGFLPLDGTPICNPACLDLPAEGFSIQQRWSYDRPLTTPVGMINVHYDVHLDLTGCGEELEVVVNVIDYDGWRPMGGQTEDEEGNQLVIEASLRGKGGCPTGIKASRFIFELLDVSAEPGVCMNFPSSQGGASGKLDLAFLSQPASGAWQAFSPPTDRLTTKDGSYTESPRAYLSSFDWGGHATLKVTAEFDDVAIPPIVGHLIDDASMTAIRIPRRKADSKVADSWKRDQAVENLPDKDDEETVPAGDGDNGDGLFLYEEYRGFYEGEGNEHISGNPKKKDLFVVDTINAEAGVELFRKATGLEVHGKLKKKQLDLDRVVNFNRSEEVGNETDQHGLVIDRVAADSGLLGIADGGPGLPAFVERILINGTITPRSVQAILGGSALNVTQEAFVIAHELLHGCNVFHHGDRDARADYLVRNVDGKLVYALSTDEEGSVTPLLKEGACGKAEPIVPPNVNAHLKNVFIAFKGGQHSGVQSCLLRYNLARYYVGAASDRVWRHNTEEPPGFLVCQGSAGTGVNASDHCPESRYGDATVGCCKTQLCVNDRHADKHVPRQAPAAACGAAGGRENDAGEGGGVAGALPAISLAVNERRLTAAYRGWPFVVTLQVIPPAFGGDGAAEDLVLTSSTGSWTSSLRFVLKKNGVVVSAWPLSPLGEAPARLVLGPQGLGLAAWWVPPQDTAQIPPGDYSLEAVLDTTSSPEGWKGIVLAEPVEVSVSVEPSPLDSRLEAEKALAFARFHAGGEALADALQAVDGLLAKQPANVAALWFRAEILEVSGDDPAALQAYEAAGEAFYAANPDAGEPPVPLLRALDEIQARIILGESTDEITFRRGDVNSDGLINISDPIATLGYLFLGSPRSLECEKSADSNDTGALNLTDAVYVLVYLFSGGAAPLAPGGACGPDPSPDALPCSSHAPCGG